MELEQWKQAMRYALLAKDTLMYIQCQEYIGDAYFLLGKEDSVVYFTQQAYETYLKYGKGLGCCYSNRYGGLLFKV